MPICIQFRGSSNGRPRDVDRAVAALAGFVLARLAEPLPARPAGALRVEVAPVAESRVRDR
jgi:hypothetical protein